MFTTIIHAIFIRDKKDYGVAQLDKLGSNVFGRRLKYIKHIRKCPRERFLVETLGQLKLTAGKTPF